ncbi:10288_t:CDS:1, partial [Cetraspora pellucida]
EAWVKIEIAIISRGYIAPSSIQAWTFAARGSSFNFMDLGHR